MNTTRKPSSARTILIGSGLTIAVLAAAIAHLLAGAVIPIPKPSGPHPVGFTTTTITDTTRNARVITLDVWYPAQSTDGFKAAPYNEAALAKMLERYQGIPASLNPETPSFAFQDAPKLPGTHPIVIFNHGHASFSKQNASNFQELASHGQIVISLAHPGESLIACDAQGKILEFDGQDPTYQQLLAAQKDANFASNLAVRLEAQRNAKNTVEHAKASRALTQTPPYKALEAQKQRWLEDTRFAIQTLQNARHPVLRNANTRDITVMGHSFGGIVALEIAKDPPAGVRRVINLDGSWLDARAPRVAVLALLSTQNKIGGHDLGLYGTFDQTAPGSNGMHVIEVAGTAHFNFTDLNYTPILKRFTPILGDVNNTRMAALQNQAILEFIKRDPASPSFSQPLLNTSNDIKQRFIPAVK